MRGGSIVLRGAELVLPDGVETGDLAIVDGRIAAVGQVGEVAGEGVEQVDARGLTVLPGIIDPQVHFREPGAPHKEDLASGSRAAAAGGVTAFLEMPNTSPPTTTPAALADKWRRAEGRCRAHYGFFFGATPDNAGTVPDAAKVPGIKVFMGSSTGTLLVDDQAALEAQFAAATVPVVVHAEDETRLRERMAAFAGESDAALHPVIRDELCALIATRRAVDLARRHQKRLHVLHLSTAEETAFLRGLPREGLVTTETLPQYLWLDSSHYAALGTRLQMNPPVRAKRHGEALWAGLLDGTIACIATDHAPHTLDEKALGFGKAPSGMPGVELSLPLMLHAVASGRCSIRHVARWMSEAPAWIYGMRGKGRLAVGYDGDVTVVDRSARRTVRAEDLHTRVGWSPFEGWTLTGWPVMTVLMGRPVFREGEFVEGVFGAALRFEHTGRLAPLPSL
ncbi:MAG: dihydroorotase [Myxococcales bacterium]|nr:dihydroorotase [Myxococcales bacterium]MCB9553048.1 dihydroorotase [Myxococcales bacterium]